MVRRKDDRPKAIDLRGGLGGRDSERGAQRARIVAGPEGGAWRMCAAHRTPSDCAERHLVTRRRTQQLTVGFTGPSVVRLRAGGRCAGRRLLAGRVECRVEWLKAVDVFG